MNYARVKQTDQGLEFYSSFDRNLVDAIKYQIPANMRRWNPSAKCWIVDNQYAMTLKNITYDCLGIALDITGINFNNLQNTPSTRLIRVEYIGQVKDRGNGDMSAYGARNANNYSYKIMFISGVHGPELEWSYVFPESTLKKWFLGSNEKETVNTSTFYTVLAVKPTTPQKEIKTAWRKMLMRYHPDVNSDEDAASMTMRINDAYNILRNPTKRKKYDAGLRLQVSLTNSNRPIKGSDFTIPVRCGMILATGHDSVGRFIVDEILEWTDIVENGRSLVTSWDKMTNSLRREWL